MIFLKGKQEWKQWVKAGHIEYADVPEKFPCFAYEQVADWGMEWSRALYLYDIDIARMVARLLPSTTGFPLGVCLVCGCTDDDCHKCVRKTGHPCGWVDEAETLCTACIPGNPLRAPAPPRESSSVKPTK
jgi:hypothetical protein